MYLSVPISEKESKRSVTVESCIKEFTKEEKLDKDEKW
jgi:ubiquitin C-terminal hydrolase